MFNKQKIKIYFLLFFLSFTSIQAFASDGVAESSSHEGFSIVFLWIAIILLLAKISNIIERIGQPPVLGELLIGIILGNLTLLGINIFDPIKDDTIIKFLAELGVVILLFQIGLESNIKDLFKVGARGMIIATVGVVVPFVLGTFIFGPLVLPNLSTYTYLFLGAALTATSVGITARVFQDLGKTDTQEFKMILVAAVIDDVLGLIILAIVSGIVTSGNLEANHIIWIVLKAFIFLAGAIFLGQLMAPYISKFFSKIHTGSGMKFTIVISFCLVFAFLASKIGLAPIVGAFAAGLVLDPVHFKYFKKPTIYHTINEAMSNADAKSKNKIMEIMDVYVYKHIEDLISPLGHFLIPIFFILTGMSVKLDALADKSIIFAALIITLVAFIGKIVSGLFAGKANKWIVGFGMIPRGEVGLIFATMGLSLGVFSNQIFSIIVIMVILSTIIPPIILNFLIKAENKK